MKKSTLFAAVLVLLLLFLCNSLEIQSGNKLWKSFISYHTTEIMSEKGPSFLSSRANASDGPASGALTENKAEFSFTEIIPEQGMESSIGYFGVIKRDNPSDNVFRFQLDALPESGTEVWLEYDLYGLDGHSGVCRSINDQPAFGGIFIRKSDTWTKAQERIPSSVLQAGDNILRFTSLPELDYGYKVKDVKLRLGNPEQGSEPEVILNQAQDRAYFGDRAYVTGFVISAGKTLNEVRVGNESARLVNGEFEAVISKPEDSGKKWSAEVTAVFKDGSTVSRQVYFEKQLGYDFEYVLPEAVFSTSENMFPGQTFEAGIAGAWIAGDENAVDEQVEIIIHSLRSNDVMPPSSGMVNVTGNVRGFRCLPHGMSFAKDVRIAIPYQSDIPTGYKPEDIFTYYFDEVSRKWVRLQRDSVDKAQGVIISRTDHFTDFINGIIKVPEAPTTNAFTPTSIKDLQVANPLDEITLVEPPKANNMGTANLSYPIKVPPGRQGLQPNLAITYNSNNANGWMGLGWNINIPAITVETRWGVPHFDQNYESETYVLDGEQLAMRDDSGFYLPVPHRDAWIERMDSVVSYYPRVEGQFRRIQRYGDNPRNYYWIVTTLDGTQYHYGKRKGFDHIDTATVLMDDQGNVAFWYLTEVKDVYGNNVLYKYQKKRSTGLANGLVKGQQLYIDEIKYTGFKNSEGPYKLKFILSNDPIRPDAIISAIKGFKEVTAHLLDRIEITFNENLIRTYFFGYKNGAYDKTLLCGFLEANSLKSPYLIESPFGMNVWSRCEDIITTPGAYSYTFDYYDDITPQYPFNVFPDTIKFTGQPYLPDFPLSFNHSDVPSKLGSSTSKNSGWGGSLTAGLGFNVWLKSLSLGGSYSRSKSENLGLLTLVDLNGDGLPDQVYRCPLTNLMYYTPMIENNGKYEYGVTFLLQGVNRFMRSVSKSNNWGLEAHASAGLASASASADFGNSKSYTGTYFADVNADGLIDIVDEGTVYFNRIENGVPRFYDVQNDTIWVGEYPCECNISISGTVDDSLFLPGIIQYGPDSVVIKEAETESHNMDAVRIWLAPFDGVITIRDTLYLSPEYNYRRVKEYLLDGVKYSLQHNGDILEQFTIQHDDTIILFESGIEVDAGDRIYFRMQSLERRLYDQVFCNPVIDYTQESIWGSYAQTDSNLSDADGIPIYQFEASKGFVLNDKQVIKLPLKGKAKVFSQIESNDNPSDSVVVRLYHNTTNIWSDTIFSQLVQKQLDTISIDTVFEGDTILCVLDAPSNVNWQNINWEVLLVYEESYDSTVSVVIDSTDLPHLDYYIKYRILPYKKIFNKTLYPTHSFTPGADINSAIIHPVFTIPPNNYSGLINLSIKNNQSVILRMPIEIFGDSIVYNSRLVSFSKDSTYYFDFHTEDYRIADLISDPGLTISGGTHYKVGLHTLFDSSRMIYGPLYRGWGQFVYNDTGTYVSQIVEDSLSIFGMVEKQIDSLNENVIDSASGELMYEALDSIECYNPWNENFNMMLPDIEKGIYYGPGYLTIVDTSRMSHFIEYLDTTEIVPDFPVPVVTPGKPVRAVYKASYSKTRSGGANFLSSGMNKSTTRSMVISDFRDMNGDRYPDVISRYQIQYSKPQGGLSIKLGNNRPEFAKIDSSETKSGGVTFGTTFLQTEKILKNNIKNANISASGSANLSGSIGSAEDEGKYTMMDINGDGLPDKIKSNGQILLNLGYSFLRTAEPWGYNSHRKSTSSNASISFAGSSPGGSVVSPGETKIALAESKVDKHTCVFEKFNVSLSGGYTASSSQNVTNTSLIDLNGDGLPDKVARNSLSWFVSYNTGSSFTSAEEYPILRQIEYSKTLNTGVNGAISFGVSLGIIPLKIVLNPKVNWGKGITHNISQLMDMNADGLPDLVMTDQDDNLLVWYNNTTHSNVLRAVVNPTGASFEMEYELSKNSYQQPSRQLLLSELRVYDNFKAKCTGIQSEALYAKTTFEYLGGEYNRFERESFGYSEVITYEHNTLESADPVYRVYTEKYHNDFFLRKGLKFFESLSDGGNNQYLETHYHYSAKEIKTGNRIDSAMAWCFGEIYPALDTVTKKYFEGGIQPEIITRVYFDHGPYGKIHHYYNEGALNDPNDGFQASLSYTFADEERYILNEPHILIVNKLGGGFSVNPETTLQYRVAVYDSNGRARIIVHFDDIEDEFNYGWTEHKVEYDSLGNITSLTLPGNHNGDSLQYHFSYDTAVQTYVTSVSDSYGYQSASTYEMRFGKQLLVTDLTGSQIEYHYDEWGRINKIRGPKEIAADAPYSVKHRYWNDSLSYEVDSAVWAVSSNFNPSDTTNPIETALFTDGLGRILQTKKDALISGNGGTNEGRIVSGRALLDPFGRTVLSWHPTSETDEQAITVFNTGFDQIVPTQLSFDVMDRTTRTILPDGAKDSVNYGFGSDHQQIIRFLTNRIDPENNYLLTYTDAFGNNTMSRAPLGAITKFRYSPLGQLMASYSPDGDSTTYQYDLLGRRISRLHPDAGETTWIFDDAGNLREMQTAFLDNLSEHIIYDYEYNRLKKINCPLDTLNNVTYLYGDESAGNQAGRVVRQVDGSGVQDFEYGSMGELIKQKRYMPLIGNEHLAFETQWEYDSWNRVTSIIYPDGEELNYQYDAGGKLYSLSSFKDDQQFSIIDSIIYDEWERKCRMYYGNGTKMTYAYDEKRGFLSQLNSMTSSLEPMQTLEYTFDLVGNILSVENSAGQLSNDIGGESSYSFVYDSLYRLVYDEGYWTYNPDDAVFSRNLSMTYSPGGRILTKVQQADILNANSTSTIMDIDYEYNYSTQQTNTIAEIKGGGDDHQFEWDANGNMAYHHYENNGVNPVDRYQCWDEMNRLIGVCDGNRISHYIYDASGERAMKFTGDISQVQINQQTVIDYALMNDYTYYPSPLISLNSRDYTKHYFIEGQRVMSKIGGGWYHGLISLQEEFDGPDMSERAELISTQLDNSLSCLNLNGEVGYELEYEWIDAAAYQDDEESFYYLYHPDHLGSSSFITDPEGMAIQHLEYLPFGELFIEERDSWNTPYKFSGKELDDETGYSYFGARYYDPNISIWLSVDPLSDKYPIISAYAYTANNPIILVDPDGMQFTKYVDEEGNTLANNEDNRKDVIIIPKRNIEKFEKEVSKYDELGTIHDPETSDKLNELGYDIKGIKDNWDEEYPLSFDADFNFGYEYGYQREYKKENANKTRIGRIIEKARDIGGGFTEDGFNYTRGIDIGKRRANEDKEAGKMNMFNPELKNNTPRIEIKTLSPRELDNLKRYKCKMI